MSMIHQKTSDILSSLHFIIPPTLCRWVGVVLFLSKVFCKKHVKIYL